MNIFNHTIETSGSNCTQEPQRDPRRMLAYVSASKFNMSINPLFLANFPLICLQIGDYINHERHEAHEMSSTTEYAEYTEMNLATKERIGRKRVPLESALSSLRSFAANPLTTQQPNT